MAAKMGYEASSSSRRWKYDVFLSFCGQDSRTNFTDHLYNNLIRDGIHTFRDNEELNRGEDISSELENAIEGSRIAIIVFSKNYASSSWCLGELVKILNCRKAGQMEKVFPVFYKVDPSDVRKQTNTYAEAFKRHEDRFKDEMVKVEKWRAALKEAADLSGWDQQNVANGHEAELTKILVEEVLKIVNQTCLHVARHPVGLDSHIERIGCLLNGGLDGARVIGIYGFGGIGKSTIAKAVFNSMFKNFEGSSFLANVKAELTSQKGLSVLQKQLLSDVLKRKDVNIDNEDRGVSVIKERLGTKRVLIVLDDVDEMEQFYKLVGGNDCFGPGSRIILTTRDEFLLNSLDVDEEYKYRVEGMSQHEGIQLFSLHAFKQNHPLEGYEKLSNDVIHYAGGLPLALVVLGSLLYKRSHHEWKSELKILRKIPNDQILQKLEISYNSLDEFRKTIFLDISCFFIGEDKDTVIKILDSCDLDGEAGIKLLIERSLLTIDDDNMLRMHDLIREMGREIVCRESPQKPGERSRLWNTDDIVDVLSNFTGTDAVKCLDLNSDAIFLLSQSGLLKIEALFKMPNLRLLRVDYDYTSWSDVEINPDHCLQGFFQKLVWLNWGAFPFECIPNNFNLENLVILDMQESKLKKVWKGKKYLRNLKILNLSGCSDLTCTPDFSGLPNLEELILQHCDSLAEIHESIDHLENLIVLDLSQCCNIRDLPRGIGELVSLKTLDISGCSELQNLPDEIGKLVSLTMLDMTDTLLEKIPDCIALLKNLTSFSSSEAQLGSISFNGFCSLKHLTLKFCHLEDDHIPVDIWMLRSLESLNLSGNKLRIPSSICQLSKLQTLDVSCCNLKSLPMLPSSLGCLDASTCSNLERLPNLSNLKQLKILVLSQCRKLTKIEGLEGLKSAASIFLSECDNLKCFPKKKIFLDINKDFGNSKVCEIFLDGDEVPRWFRFQSESKSLSFQVAQLENMEMQGLIICIACSEFDTNYRAKNFSKVAVIVVNESKNISWRHENYDIPINPEEETTTWVIKVPHSVWKSIAEDGDRIDVLVEAFTDSWENTSEVKKIGVHLFHTSQHRNWSPFAPYFTS